jgi:hypothetical protein
LNLGVREEWDLARIAGEDSSVEERRDASVRGTDVVAIEALPPDVEELAEPVGALYRRFGVDDPVGCVCVQPREARAGRHE